MFIIRLFLLQRWRLLSGKRAHSVDSGRAQTGGFIRSVTTASELGQLQAPASVLWAALSSGGVCRSGCSPSRNSDEVRNVSALKAISVPLVLGPQKAGTEHRGCIPELWHLPAVPSMLEVNQTNSKRYQTLSFNKLEVFTQVLQNF